MKKLTDLSYGEHPLQKLDLYLPEVECFPLLIYFHGGGLTGGDKSRQELFCSHLAKCGIAVANANYRLYPEAHYPDYLEDAAGAVAWVHENISRYGKATKTYIGGSSAGGYLSQMLCFDGRWLSARGLSPLNFAGFIHDAGQPTCHFNVLRERGIDSKRVIIDDGAPLYHVGEDEEYPPMLIIVSTQDMENRYEQTMLLCSTLKHFGHTEGVTLKILHGKHCAYVNAEDENGESIFGQTVFNYLKEHLK